MKKLLVSLVVLLFLTACGKDQTDKIWVVECDNGWSIILLDPYGDSPTHISIDGGMVYAKDLNSNWYVYKIPEGITCKRTITKVLHNES